MKAYRPFPYSLLAVAAFLTSAVGFQDDALLRSAVEKLASGGRNLAAKNYADTERDYREAVTTLERLQPQQRPLLVRRPAPGAKEIR